MEALRPRGGGISHASPPGVGNVASQLTETQDMPVTPTPTRWQSRNVIQPVLNDGSMESVSMDGNEGQECWQPGGSSRAPSRASEARSGIRQRKILQKTLIGRPKHQTSLLDASKHTQVLMGALEAAQTQQQEMYQMVLEQVQAHLAEELSNWRAEQQIQEGLYLEWITKLELEVSKLSVAVASQPDPIKLKPAKDCPKEAWRLLFHCEGGKATPRSEREDVILAINQALAKEGFPAFIQVVDAGYTNTGAITILLEKGTLGSMLLPNHKDLLVTAA
ncbi:hypothetical protein SI65_09927 [Aspergillus cristatus]|uniref:Uncharacterized protein n=1 Tax=Aspergillus cristatus TaxID=573508 RepID=A0A1E3B0X9_ASPCR|nr:hypothetical protein SI65_09927 [Aspergillus cristatus]